LAGVGAGSQVLTSPDVVVVTKGSHTLKRVAAERICVTEVILRTHVLAHPLGSITQLAVEGEGAQTVSGTVLVHQVQEDTLFTIS